MSHKKTRKTSEGGAPDSGGAAGEVRANAEKDKGIPHDGFVPCRVAQLPPEDRYAAARTAFRENPANGVRVSHLAALLGSQDEGLIRGAISVLTTKYWSAGVVELTVGFMENVGAQLADRILSHMNAWGTGDATHPGCAVKFTMIQGAANKAQVRITLRGQGYWSYLGSDVLSIRSSEPTMCLQGFSMNTPESEYRRVVRHETGHTLGCPHEHMRRQIIQRLDPNKTVEYFRRTQGWSQQEVVQQVLTPLDERSILGTPDADVNSIMCYQLPGSITNDGRPIPGGSDIEDIDWGFMQKLYPKVNVPPPPPPTDGSGSWKITLPTGAVITGTGPKPVIA